MSKFYKQIAKGFPGDKDLGESFIKEIENILKAINALDRLTRQNFSSNEGKPIITALATASAEIISEIEVPIAAKYPDLAMWP